jgi:hypothetical protein
MPKVPAGVTLCSWCRKKVSIAAPGGEKVLREVPLEETEYKAGDFESHGICSECSKKQLAEARAYMAARKNPDEMRSVPPVWVVDKAEWRRAYDLARKTYKVNPRRKKEAEEFYAVVAHIYKQLGGRIGSKSRRNPLNADLTAVGALYRAFTGRAPGFIDVVKVETLKMPNVVAYLGELRALEYDSDKFDGKRRRYRHEFKRPRPTVVADETGQLWIVGGGYKITERGIEA